MNFEHVTEIIIFIFAGAGAAATFLPPDHLDKKTRIIIFYFLVVLTLGYALLQYIFFSKAAKPQKDLFVATATPMAPFSNPVSIWFRDGNLDIKFAPGDTPKPHLYLAFHFEIFNSTDETRLLKTIFGINDLVVAPNWKLTQETINEIGENTAISNSEVKINPKSPMVFDAILLFETGDQTKSSFYDEMQMFSGKFKLMLKVITDHNESSKAVKSFDTNKIKEEMISIYKNAFPDHASQWVTTH